MIIDYYSIDPTSFRYISHHGILGQKWGVRRFQNEDGSLKPAGKGRYTGEAIPKNMFGKAIQGSSSRSISLRNRKRTEKDQKGKLNYKHNSDKVEQWLKENYIYYGTPGSTEYLNRYSDYDNMTTGERMMLDAEEEEMLEKMTPDERRKYIEKIRERQMAYIDKHVTTDKYLTDHSDGRYNLIDKAREHVTGKLDADNVQSVRDAVVNSQRDRLAATHKWSENEEAIAAKE